MDILTFFYILTSTAVILYLYSKWLYTYWKRRGVPYLEPEFPYGNTKEFVKRKKAFGDQMSDLYTQMKSKGLKYGGIYLFLRPTFIPIDLELIKCILQKNFTSFMNHGMYVNEKADPLSGHLFNLEDERWRNMRTKLSPTFTSGKMKMMFQTLVDCSNGFEDILSSHQLLDDPVDIKDVLCRFTTDVIGSCAFGIDCNSIKNPDSEFRQYGKRIFTPDFWRRIRGMMTMVIPNHVLAKLHFRLTASDIADFFKKVVQDTITYRETNNIYRKDFMHMMLQLKNRGELTEDENVVQEGTTNKTNGVLSINEITAQCFVFFLAGFETSATTMTFALYELAANPEIQNKLRDEMRTILKRYDGKMTYEAIQEMTYLDTVVHETLRKHPPVPGTPRVCNTPFKIPNTNVILEKGTQVHIPFQAIQRDPEYYPDPDKFDPERFSEKNKAKRPAYAFLSFGEGPRICIGARFGLMQAKVGLTAIISKFRVKVNKKMKLPIKYSTTSLITAVEGGVWLDIEKNSIMNISTVVYIPILIAVIVYLYSKWLYTYWKRKGIPYLEPEFPYGNIKEFIKRKMAGGEQMSNLYTKMKSKGLKYGGIYIFLRPTFLPIDLELIKCIMQKNFTSFMNHGTYVNEEDDPLSGHLFSLEDEKWRTLRAKLSPAFTSGKMKMMFQTLVDCSKGFEDILSSQQLMEDPIEIKEVVSRFTIDVIGSCAFGIDCNSMKNPHSEFAYYGKNFFNLTMWGRIKALLSLVIPNHVLVKLHFKLTDSDIEDFFMKVVRDTIAYRETNNIYRKDFMHMMLQLKNRGELTEDENVVQEGTTSKTNDVLSINEITAQCFVFFLAGFETSATTMTFALYELAANSEIQNKLRKEMRTILKKYDGKMTYEAIQEMTYLDRVVHETLRKHPPVPGIPRICNTPFNIPDTDVILEKGTQVHIPFYAIHRDPEYYPDPDKFDPDRFSEENRAKRPTYAFLPFGEGPRICIGSRFGLMQTKVGITAIISKFRVSLNKKMKLPIKYTSTVFVTSIEGGVWLDTEKID